ncbi:PREDICTED: putative serine protease 46 [Miniopterus natalensis]|uniref:putative serine protease 46 n=1 Tax=Miniopterus natalensis TaxID=291302 RepID=UPI0007A6E11A|nr:PREDICTED: putative serine protease 46 [Miniopterus natalensis]
MACEPDLGVTSPLAFGRLGNPLYVEEPFYWGCGQTNMSCKVVKGKLVEVGKWPWQVSILFLGMYVCSGSLIHHRWILTAAHCLERSLNPDQYSVMVGVQHLPEKGTHLPLAHIVIHENFKNLIANDIALLKLKDPVLWSPLVQPICLPTTNLRPSVGTSCWAIVWGRTDTKVTPKPPYSLQEVSVKIIKHQICDRQYQFLFLKGQKKFIGKEMLCASSEWGADSCQMNSGSPMVCQVNKTWVQMGVESWSFSCKQHHYPNIYTSTSLFTQWIRKQIGDVKFISRAHSAFLSPVFHTGYILLVSLGSLWLL